MRSIYILWITLCLILFSELKLIYGLQLPQQNIDQTIYVSPFAASQNPCNDIRNGQFLCLDCTTLAFCIQEGGNWVTMKVETCDNKKYLYCDENAIGCTIQRECGVPSRGIPFECQNPGIYPDPYNCKYYHVCDTDNVHSRRVCSSGMGYSVATQDCSVPLNSAICKEQQYQCDRPGYMAAWPGDANIFYVCFAKLTDEGPTIFPRVYRCADGKIFDGENCVPSENSTSSPDSTTAVTVPTTCTDNKLSPDPTNCKSYFYCQNGQKIRYQCGQGYYFNPDRLACDRGTC